MSRQLDVVLINPGGRKGTYQRMAEFTAVEPPVWAGLIATFLRHKGKGVVLMDVNALEQIGYDQEQAAKDIISLNPRLVAVVVYGHNPSATTQTMPAAGDLCKVIKEQNPFIPIVMVGGHVAALPARTLMEEDCDFVSQGEGPYSLLELIDALTVGGQEYKKAGDVWYREDGQPKWSGKRSPLVWNLDEEMNGMAYDLMPMNLYRTYYWHTDYNPNTRKPYAAMYTTLGCPYNCSFCNIQLPLRSGEQLKNEERMSGKKILLSPQRGNVINSYRRWSPENVVSWFDVLVNKYGIKNFKLADELFILHRDHVTGICSLLKDRGYDLNVWCYARPDSVGEMQNELKSASILKVCLGIEGGTEKSRLGIDKKFGQRKIYDVVKKLHDAGIKIQANYIFGLPEDDLDGMRATYDLSLDLNTAFANFYPCMALPGTELYNEALAKGWKLPDSWNGFAYHSYDCLPMPTKYLSGEEVLWFRDEAWHRFFNSSAYLGIVQNLFGSEAVAYVKIYASEKPERKNAIKPEGFKW